MKQLIFSWVEAKRYTGDLFKRYFHCEKGEKRIFSKLLLSMKTFFYTCASIYKVNNSFAIKNDEISHFENFNHASPVNG